MIRVTIVRTRTEILRYIRIGTFAVIAIIIIAYAVWRSFNYARGPEIIIDSPQSGSSITASTTTITGKVLRSSNLTLDGNTVSVDQNGNFNESLIIFHGQNEITFVATDQFGRSIEKRLEIIGL